MVGKLSVYSLASSSARRAQNQQIESLRVLLASTLKPVALATARCLPWQNCCKADSKNPWTQPSASNTFVHTKFCQPELP